MKYLKLHPNADSYNDSISGLSLARTEVVALESSDWGSKKFANVMKAVQDGHLQDATKAEYQEHLDRAAGVLSDEKKAAKESRKKKVDMKTDNSDGTKLKEEATDTDEEDTDEEDTDEDTDGDTDTDDDDDTEPLTEGEKRDALKESGLLKPDQLKNLGKLKGKPLQNLYQELIIDKKIGL